MSHRKFTLEEYGIEIVQSENYLAARVNGKTFVLYSEN